MAHLDLDVPDEPEKDFDAYEVINTFYLAGRGRRYVGGAGLAPMPLSVQDISNVLNAHPVTLDREVLDSCVFALDDIYLSESSEKKEKPKDE